VKLANLLRMGMIHPVHHTADPARQGFKELVLMYEDAVHEVVRVKTRLKAKFQQQGVRCVGSDVYRAERRAQWLEQLPRSEARYQVELLWDDLEHAVRKCERLRQVVCRRARGIEVIRRFQAVPGIGWIRAALFYVIVDTPQRFAHRRKLWTYCGIGVAQRRSGEQAEPAHLTRRGNPRLKAVAKGAALTAIAAGKNRFAAQFGGLISQGRLPSRARLTVARSLVSTLYEMWRRGTAYREEEDEPTREFTRRRRAR
jgi:transposase